jgi:putative protease
LTDPVPRKAQSNGQTVELLAPAGNWEKMEIAVHFGADAIYLSGRQFSLRSLADNFSDQELAEAVAYCHARGVLVYVACNAFIRNADQRALEMFLKALAPIGPDAIIVADPGVLATVSRLLPTVPIHLSTQANTTNTQSARFWKQFGVSRINAARELAMDEIAQIAHQSGLAVEAFVHGSMCMAYSGRCLLSSYLTRRDGNQGRCTQACRWKYTIAEETRPGQYFPIEEDSRNTYILSAEDLCMIDHIPAMIKAGITALKIEGRMKGIGYLGPVVKTYREAIDSYGSDPAHWQPRPEWLAELERVSHRPYSTGFFFNEGVSPQAVPSGGTLKGGHAVIGKVISRATNGRTRVDIRNKIVSGERVSVLRPGASAQTTHIDRLFDVDGAPLAVAHPGTVAELQFDAACSTNDLIRRGSC